MKRQTIVVAVVAFLAAVAVAYLWGPTATPAGQDPFTKLSSENVSEFAAAFDGAADEERLVLLLSPT